MKEQTRSLRIVNPVADYQDFEQPVLKSPQRPHSIKGKTIAMVPNWKAISPPFMAALAQRVTKGADAKHAFMHNPDWQFTHPERVGKIGPEIDKLARECDLMVSGVAD